MNREIQKRREEELFAPYRRVCEEVELFEIGLRSLRGRTQLVARQLFVQRKAIPTVEDDAGKPLGRKTVEAERERALNLYWKSWIEKRIAEAVRNDFASAFLLRRSIRRQSCDFSVRLFTFTSTYR